MKKIIPIILILSIGVFLLYITTTSGKNRLGDLPLNERYEICKYEKSLSYLFGDTECAWHINVNKQLVLPEKFVPADESDLAFAKGSIITLLNLAERKLNGYTAYRIPHTPTSTYYLLRKDDSKDVYIYLFKN